MSAKKKQSLPLGKLYHLFLRQLFAFGGQINSQRLPVRVYGVDAIVYGLRHHDHTRSAAERIVVALFMLVGGKVAYIDNVDLQNPSLSCATDNRIFQRRKHFGKKRKNVNSHLRLPLKNVFCQAEFLLRQHRFLLSNPLKTETEFFCRPLPQRTHPRFRSAKFRRERRQKCRR